MIGQLKAGLNFRMGKIYLVHFLGQFLTGHWLGNHWHKSGKCRWLKSLFWHLNYSHQNLTWASPHRRAPLPPPVPPQLWRPLTVPFSSLHYPSSYAFGFTAELSDICKSVKFAHDFFTKDTVLKWVLRFLARGHHNIVVGWKCFPESQEIFGTRLDDDAVDRLDD